MPVLPAAADWCAYLDAMADDALAGRIPDTGVIRIAPVPDLVDVSSLDHRKDGTSVYRPPGEERFATAAHIDTEEWILEKASKGAVPQLVTEGRAAAALAGTDLDPQQRRAVTGMLTSTRFFSCLVAAAGTGKTHVMAAFSTAWAQLTGGRVICLTLSENAARVAAGEGFTEAWNIARFFASKVPVGRGDVLVIDEASQVSTQDLARICSLALQAGARVIGVGDTRQLPAVEAGGLFSLIARRHGHWKLTEVRRFAQAWERAASVRLGDGDVMALAEYAARGRIWDGPQDRVYDDAVDLYMTDVARGKQALLLAGSNEEAARLARLVRDRRIERGQIGGRREVTLRDGNPAGTGDLVRARLNTSIDAGGRRLTNRDTLRLIAFRGAGKDRFAVAERQTGPGRVVRPVRRARVLPRAERRARLRRERLHQPGHDGRHRPAGRVRGHEPGDALRGHDPRPRGEHRARGDRAAGPGGHRPGPSGRPSPARPSSGPGTCSGRATGPRRWRCRGSRRSRTGCGTGPRGRRCSPRPWPGTTRS